MSDVPDRLLTILTDGKVMKGYRRARLRGRDALGLYPMPFTLQIWNLSTSDYLQLCSARKVTVKSGSSVLASGYVSNVSQRNVDDGLLTEAVFSAGLKLWESQVSVSVGAGSSVAGSVQAILSASGVMKLLSYQGTDRSFSRGAGLLRPGSGMRGAGPGRYRQPGLYHGFGPVCCTRFRFVGIDHVNYK